MTRTCSRTGFGGSLGADSMDTEAEAPLPLAVVATAVSRGVVVVTRAATRVASFFEPICFSGLNGILLLFSPFSVVVVGALLLGGGGVLSPSSGTTQLVGKNPVSPLFSRRPFH